MHSGKEEEGKTFHDIIANDINSRNSKNMLVRFCDKKEAMLITKIQIHGSLLPIKVGKQVIKYAEITNCLGAIIEDHLKWQYQTDAGWLQIKYSKAWPSKARSSPEVFCRIEHQGAGFWVNFKDNCFIR